MNIENSNSSGYDSYEDDDDDDDDDIDNIDNQFLAFDIGDEQYGIGIAQIMEIIEMVPITPIPNMEHYIKGVINLRGKVLPVMDVRLRFTMEEKEYDAGTCIIVVQINDLEIGLIVDSVSEVVEIKDEEMQRPPNISQDSKKRFVLGMARVEEKVTILLELEKLLYEDDFEKLIEVVES